MAPPFDDGDSQAMGRGAEAAQDRIISSAIAAALLAPIFATLQHEEMRVLHLDEHFGLLRNSLVGRGGAHAMTMPMRTIIGEALAIGSRAIVLAHNHPGGDPLPSRADRRATRRFAAVAAALDIRLIDHLVLAPGGWSSFRAMGLL